MNMRQRFGLVLLLAWTKFPLRPYDFISQIAWFTLLVVSVAIFTFPSKDEPQ